MLTLIVTLAGTDSPAVTGPGPWDLTLDTLIAGLGALVTIGLTVFAICQTGRANRLQKSTLEAQAALETRQRRFTLFQAMLAYIDVVEIGRHGAQEHDTMVLTSIETGLGHDPLELEWVEAEAYEVADLYRQVDRDADGNPLSQVPHYDHIAAKLRLRRRLAHWVDTGEFPKNKTWSTKVGAPEDPK